MAVPTRWVGSERWRWQEHLVLSQALKTAVAVFIPENGNARSYQQTLDGRECFPSGKDIAVRQTSSTTFASFLVIATEQWRQAA